MTLLDKKLQALALLTVPGEFLQIRRLGTPPRDEWMAVLPDRTEIVVPSAQGKPDALGIEKAIAIVLSRADLESRARELLAPFGMVDGEWQLLAIDFGVEAQHHECEFLMCFAFQATGSDLGATSPYVEVGFALPVRVGVSPLFVLTIRSTAGLD